MPLDFVAIDFETANAKRASACSVGLVKYRNGEIVDQVSELFKPPKDFDYFDPWNIQIHGISEKDVKNKPRFETLWPELKDFIGGDIVVAHNAAFDMSVLRNTLKASDIGWPTINYLCTMVLSRTIFNLTSNSLPFVAEAAGVNWEDSHHHDAGFDARVCGDILVAISRKLQIDNISELLSGQKIRIGSISEDAYEACGLPSSNTSKSSWDYKPPAASTYEVNVNANESNPIYGKLVAFTGSLHQYSRPEAMALIANLGAYPQDAVTKSTDILVVGEQDPQKLKPGEVQSSKFRKAEKLRAAGQNIEVMTERDFISFIELDIP